MSLRHILFIILTLPLYFIYVQGKADPYAVDSLKQLLNQARRDDRRVDLLNEIANQYLKTDIDHSFYYAKQALNLANRTNLRRGIAYSSFILGVATEKTNSDSSIYFYNQALNYYQQINDQYNVANSYNSLGLLYKDIGQYQQALEHFLLALQIIKDKEQLGVLYNNIGVVYRRSGSYEKAIEYFINSLNIREEIKDKNGVAITSGNLGNIYLNQKQYEKAIEYYKRAKTLFEESNNKLYEAHALQNIGIINTHIKKFDAAVESFDKALQIYSEVNYEIGSAVTLINKARIFSETQNFTEAITNNLHAIEILKKYNSKEYMTSAYIEVGTAYFKDGNINVAKEFLFSGLSLAQEIGNKQKESEAYEGIYKYYEAQSEFKHAFDYYKQFTLIKDSLFNEDVSKRMSAILSSAEIEKREKEKDLLQERIRRKELENKALVGGTIFLILFAAYFFNTTQQKKKTNRLLSAQNEEINQKQGQIISINESLQKSQRQLFRLNDKLQKMNAGLETTVKERTYELQKSHEELDTFLYQSSHALRRPIVNIMGLVQIARIEPEFATVPNIYDKIEDTASRMDLMLKKLVMVSEINLSDQSVEVIDFEEIVSEAITTLGPELLFKKIEINKILAVNGCFKSDRRLFLIIIQNLMENAINFFTDVDNRKSFIDLSVVETNENIELIVHDNGIGIPFELQTQVFDMFYVATTRSKGYGLGLYIVKKAVEKLKGQIQIDSKENEFTKVIISIPRTL